MAIRRALRGLVLLTLLSSVSGCAYGLLYTSVRRPVVINMDRTPFGSAEGTMVARRVSIPATSVNLSVEWNSRAIGDAARKAGLTEIYYADSHTFSILGGIWRERTIDVYGR